MSIFAAKSGPVEVWPPFGAFKARYAEGTGQLLWTRLAADLETPVSAYLKLAAGRPMSFLLESVEGGAARGRYSVIGFDPDLVWKAHGQQAVASRGPHAPAGRFLPETSSTLASLRALLAESRLDLPAGLPPMAAGIFGYMGYDTVRLAERLPDSRTYPLGIPDSLLIRPQTIAVFDSVTDVMTLATPVRPQANLSARAAYEGAVDRLAAAVTALESPLPHPPGAPGRLLAAPEPVSNTPKDQYLAMVERAKEYIAAGDIFQVVLSQRFSAPFTLPSFALYRALRRLNPSPFLFHFDFGTFALAGSSPEILVRVRSGEVTIRPIAGTAPRGATAEEDAAAAAALLADPKERAEHLMLLDLGRNDVGRVAEVGSVAVTERFVIERYSHVMHIVSNVKGTLRKDCDVLDALMAGFPAGTVSGAPKVRAMQIIDELEAEKRGPYAGCAGYFSAGGDMDTCILLRTALLKDGAMYVQAGGGIVYDSDSGREFQESVNKAKALFRAAEEAVRFANSTPQRG